MSDYTPFKMKGMPMIQGSSSHKQAIAGSSPNKQIPTIIKYGAKYAGKAIKYIDDLISGGTKVATKTKPKPKVTQTVTKGTSKHKTHTGPTTTVKTTKADGSTHTITKHDKSGTVMQEGTTGVSGTTPKVKETPKLDYRGVNKGSKKKHINSSKRGQRRDDGTRY